MSDVRWGDPREYDERELVVDRDRAYELNGEDSRTLAAVGAFRVVPAQDFHIDHEIQQKLDRLDGRLTGRIKIWWPRFYPDGTACSLGSNWLERSRTPHNALAQRFTLSYVVAVNRDGT